MSALEPTDQPSVEMVKLKQASTQVLLPVEEGDRAYGTGTDSRIDEIDDLRHAAEHDLAESFEVVWDGTAETDFETLDRLATQWEELPEEEVLLEIALTWGALVGERIIDAVGGTWVYREDPLHHCVVFERTQAAFFPMHAVVARFMLGDLAGLEAGYHQLVEFLTET